MDIKKETFLKNEFLTMSVFAALGRSKTYSKPVSENNKNLFRDALREKLTEIGDKYNFPITEQEHLSNINELSNNLTPQFSHCLRNGRFRIGIAQKALNLYLKYLWCVGLIPTPPHCPFDSIIIGYIPECKDLNWTSIDSIDDYLRLVKAANNITGGKTLSEWELEVWEKFPQPIVSPQKSLVKENVMEKPQGLSIFARKFHDNLKEVMIPYKNDVLETKKIKKIIESVPAFKGEEQWIFPSDHCINHTNKGACPCKLTKDAIFEKVKRGLYRVL